MTAPRVEGRWSTASRVAYTGAPEGAVVQNVDDRQLTSPLQGFGKLWRKQYRLRLEGTGATPEQIVDTWKAEFPTFWPSIARFYGSGERLAAGDSALINLRFGGVTLLSTGILVLFEDDRSFTFMTPEGHIFAAWITFSAEEADGVPTAQVEVLIRASDPLFELLMASGGKLMENYQWRTVLRNLAARVGAQPARPTFRSECVDRRRQWRYVGNLKGNSAVRTASTCYGIRAAASGPDGCRSRRRDSRRHDRRTCHGIGTDRPRPHHSGRVGHRACGCGRRSVRWPEADRMRRCGVG